MSCSVAIIDDHELVRNGLRGIVNGFEGYEVQRMAKNGREFIEQNSMHNAPDIVLLDVNMPIMDGYETALWIRENLPVTKVLALTMLDDEQAVIRMLKNGASGYVLKDSKPATLLQALEALRTSGFFINEIVNARLIQFLNGSHTKEQVYDIFTSINEREKDFLQLAASDLSYREIAEKMNVSPRTIENYRDAVFDKLGVKTRVGAVMMGIKYKIIVL